MRVKLEKNRALRTGPDTLLMLNKCCLDRKLMGR